MARIVCLTSGMTGILNASFELVSRLEAAGHHLIYASPTEVGDQVRKQGLRYTQLPPVCLQPEPDVPHFSGPLRRLKRWTYKLRKAKLRRRQALEALDIDNIDHQLEDFNADLLIIDVELHEYIMLAYTRQIPFVILSQWFSLWPQPGLPYLLHDTIPGRGRHGHHLAISLSWQWVKAQRWWMFLKKKLFSLGADRRSSLLMLARKLAFPSALIRENYWPGPFTYNTLPVISMTAWEMEFPHTKRPYVHYVGPMVYTKRREESGSQDVEEKLSEVLALKGQQGAELKLIYCSVSSLKPGDEDFLRKVCQAVADEPSWILILGLGGRLESSSLAPLPRNVYPFAWAPQLRILPHADCSINHGGIHTIHECLHFGVPMLVYSGKRSDQNGCAARVAYHGLGLRGDKDRDTVADIHRNIRTVLYEKSYRECIQNMQQYCYRYRTEKRLEKLIDGLLPTSVDGAQVSVPSK